MQPTAHTRRGKYVDRYVDGYQAATNLVLLDPDVAAALPDAQAVNEALRLLIKVARTVSNEG